MMSSNCIVEVEELMKLAFKGGCTCKVLYTPELSVLWEKNVQ